jgi:hypothetical protein
MYGYTTGVAERSVDINCRAYGGVVYTETCADCGATRRVASNGVGRTRHEYSLWHSGERAWSES